MEESDVIDALVAELQFAKASNWQQPGYKDSLFRTFKRAPRDEHGLPALHGDDIRQHIRDRLGRESAEFKAIEKVLYEVASAWNEWTYAIKNWPLEE